MERLVGRILDRAAIVAFLLGAAALLFLLGFQVHAWKAWPYQPLNDAKTALRAVYDRYLLPDFGFIRATSSESGVSDLDEAARAPGHVFATMQLEDGFKAVLLDAGGEVRHSWYKPYAEIWPEGPPHITSQGNYDHVRWHGIQLMPNGDIIANYEGSNFPYGGGLVRLDPQSEIVWKLAENTHHDVHLAEDGTLWVPSMRVHEGDVPGLARAQNWFYEDLVLQVSSEGEVLQEISVLQALKGLPGVLPHRLESDDPTHLNNVEVVSEAFAATSDLFEVGDILVSLRNLNALVLIDAQTHLAKWILSGPFAGQHDPDLLANGNIMVYDNKGGLSAGSGSRILEIDPETQQIVWSFVGEEVEFYSEAWGNLDVLPNGNVLFSESFGGRIFEVTREPEPRVVWTYHNNLGEIDGEPTLGFVGDVLHAPASLNVAER